MGLCSVMIYLLDYVQNKNDSMINEHKRAISGKNNLMITKNE